MKLLNLFTATIFVAGLTGCEPNDTEQLNKETVYKYTYQRVEGDPLNTFAYTLDNGLKVYMSINPAEPRIQTNIAVNTGSKQDPSDATGLAHYLEHMLFKGTSQIASLDWDSEKILLQEISDLYEVHRIETDLDKRKVIYHQIDSLSGEAAKFVVANEYDKMIGSLGAKGTNAYTSVERTVYINDIPTIELEKWMAIESERFSELVLRLFHTELEAVYEEYNRSRDNDYWLAREKMGQSLFPTHPYGTQTTIGTSAHLKSPSMEKIHGYFNDRYVANNMAIIMAGDIDPDATIDLIKKYFGGMRTGEVPTFSFTPEVEITTPISNEVFGSNSEWVNIGYRLPGVNDSDMYMAELFSGLLYNRQAGLMDLDLIKSQRILGGYAYIDMNKDYSTFTMQGESREGQSLESVKDLLIAEIEKIKNGEFEEWMLPAVIKNNKLTLLRYGEYNWMRTSLLTDVFIFDQTLEDVVERMAKEESVTKDQIVNFANKYFKNNYSVVYKRHGKSDVPKVEKPEITEITLNRDTSSLFATHIDTMPSTRMVPVYSDFNETIKRDTIKGNIPFYYVNNAVNGLFQLEYILDMGSFSDKEMALAVKYLKLLGTKDQTSNELEISLFKLGLSFDVYTAQERIYVSLSGLDDSFEEGVKIFESILANVEPNQEKYDNLVADVIKERADNKLTKWRILYYGLMDYGKYGPVSPMKNILSADELNAMDISVLTEKIKSLENYAHYIYYYGSLDQTEVDEVITRHHNSPAQLTPLLPSVKFPELEMTENLVYFVNYDMVQSEMMMLSKAGPYAKDQLVNIKVFNEYFGRGLSSIVFQEIRESKALAYSAYASFTTPYKSDRSHYVQAYVGTQVDKLKDAKIAMQELMNNMPEAEDQFQGAKLAALKKIETSRSKAQSVFWQYLSAKEFGRDFDINEQVYADMKTIEMPQLKTFFNENVKDRKYTYLVIGNKDLLDMEALKSMGEFQELTLEEVFGY